MRGHFYAKALFRVITVAVEVFDEILTFMVKFTSLPTAVLLVAPSLSFSGRGNSSNSSSR